MGTRDRKRAERKAWADEGQRKKTEHIFDMEDIEEGGTAGGETAEEPAGRRQGKGNRLTGSLVAKTVAFFLLAFSCLIGIGTGSICVYMAIHEFYTSDKDDAMMQMLNLQCLELVYDAERYIRQGNVKAVSQMLSEHNLDLELLAVGEEETAKLLWSTKFEYETNLTKVYSLPFEMGEKPVKINGHALQDGEVYLYRVYIDPSFPKDDSLRDKAELTETLYGIRYGLAGLCAGALLLWIICFLFLMCSAGHRNGWWGIVPGVLTSIHLDVLTFLVGGAALAFCAFLPRLMSSRNVILAVAVFAVSGTVLMVGLVFYCMDFAIRVKLGKCWRHSLIYIMLRWCFRAVCFLCRVQAKLVKGIPLVFTTVILYLGVCILEFMGVIIFVREGVGVLLWAVEKIVLLVVIVYIALVCRKLLEASKALAEGREGYRVDTSRMIGDFKVHGENLNSLGQGISKAVEERTKSERMKTELISNVSHDLKTPLTSIINYADLIWEEVNYGEKGGAAAPERVCTAGSGGDAAAQEDSAKRIVDINRVKEYAEVLLRQSRRLKKLLEDLVEASKATTGNLEVNLEPCEAGVLLSQAVGEYQQRMEEKGLELIARQPEEPVTILADGRRLWRVFENLLNNICKYAQENSRVYLNVHVKEERVQIIFRNMSKYPLEVSADELEERFVRGDKSRHMEGNGLGLSIAKSLVELQNGRMEIVIDGDLFKVMLSFPLFFQ